VLDVLRADRVRMELEDAACSPKPVRKLSSTPALTPKFESVSLVPPWTEERVMSIRGAIQGLMAGAGLGIVMLMPSPMGNRHSLVDPGPDPSLP